MSVAILASCLLFLAGLTTLRGSPESVMLDRSSALAKVGVLGGNCVPIPLAAPITD